MIQLKLKTLVLMSCLIFSCVYAVPACAYTSDSPEVQGMVKKAVRYFDKQSDIFNESQRVLIATALLKCGQPETHETIRNAKKDCIEWTQSDSMIKHKLDSIYKLCVVGLFFCELDANQFKTQIQRLMKELEDRQKPFGGWGYPPPSSDAKFGDTSMTQYAILFAWTSKAVGAGGMSQLKTRKATNWLLRTQDPTGAWSYQGRDPEHYDRTDQEKSEIRHSLVAAGVGSLYICSGMLGFTNDAIDIATKSDLPPALRLVVNTKSADKVIADTEIDRKILRRAIRDGDKWFAQNYQIRPKQYPMYYLYILERYKSFKAAAESKNSREPGWYNDGVRLLKKQQDRNGFWDFSGGNGRDADTAFALMFLMRSTQKTLAKQDDQFGGLLVAGRGLPNSSTMEMKGGQIVATPFQGSASMLLEILENEAHPDFDAVATASMTIAKDPNSRQIQQRRLRRLARAESFEARIVAVRTLARMGSLDDVPTLIYALTDPDARVVLAARNGLRLVSRNFTGFGLPESPSPAEKQAAIKKWKAWYRDIRPNATFLD